MILEKLILDMYKYEMIKFGEFTLKSGKRSYVYADIRSAISYPDIFKTLCDMLYEKMQAAQYQHICGVPYSALAFASAIAYTHKIPMLLKRKEAKDYGTKKALEGTYKNGDICLVIEDVVTTGSSILETISALKEHGLQVHDVVTFMNRNQGGREELANSGYKLHSIIDLFDVLDILHKNNKIALEDKEKAIQLIRK